MRLSDIMSGAGLTMFPEIGLVIFLLVFAAIVWRIYFRRHSIDLEVHGQMPLNDQSVQPFPCPGVESDEPA